MIFPWAFPVEITSEEFESDILVFPGENPEMFFKKGLHDKKIIYDIKHFKGVVIGESTGTELQLKRYFITSTNNFYKYQFVRLSQE